MSLSNKQTNVLILGAGIAGLSAAFYLRKKQIPVTVFDANHETGGNCRTLNINGFLFDTGAHRIHDKDSEITGQIIQLLGGHLKKTNIPSKIFDNGRLLSFPLEPHDVFNRMDMCFTFKAGLDLLKSRLNKKIIEDFEGFAVNSYGKAMANRFLLNYSKKLWGMPCNELSPEISGERLKNLTFAILVKNFFSKKHAERIHYEGEFYYPERGIGQLPNALESEIGNENIKLKSRISGVFHDNGRIEGIYVNGKEKIGASNFVSTLPINDFINMMQPAPPQNILDIAKTLKFRNIRLAVFFIRNKSINNAATMYFPSDNLLFTRGYEPRNRSSFMSPQGTTSFVVEVPCFENDWAWMTDNIDFKNKIKEQVVKTGLIREKDILGCADEKITHAYPVLEKDYQQKMAKIFDYLSRFTNLEISGRSGLFKYLWIHNLIREGKNISERITLKM